MKVLIGLTLSYTNLKFCTSQGQNLQYASEGPYKGFDTWNSRILVETYFYKKTLQLNQKYILNLI